MIREMLLAAAAAGTILATTSAALAQGAEGRPVASQSNGGLNTGAAAMRRKTDGAPPRKISREYAERLTRLPDFNGAWNPTTPDANIHRALFDPSNVHVPYHWSEELPAFGPQPGSYLTGIPYKPEFQARYMETVKNTAEGRSIDPAGTCKPFGMPRLMGGSVSGFDLVMAPDIIILHFSFDNAVRKIFMDGRPHPAATGATGQDNRTYTGHSTGRWEGDTLVVDTVNMLPGFYDQTDPPSSGEVHLVERIRLIDAETMENAMTIEDPVMFTRPWQVTRIYQRPPASEAASRPGRSSYRNLSDGECSGVDMSKGYQSVVLPMELEAQAGGAP